ncbi:LacI family transcriptional regulator [Ruegeria sp. ANG-S4]|uniref:LacI family DNA-binding transcriptional regulator n=1 Tax=Ruegeria sp. ANG-S4 TaxID=1577904 RepID=UPI000580B3B7|nr:LacI family DNA-binding transcriptional regulator [Ruegeria sp. ANG-S4]KIC46706.1 LacI family transcriptional regulator [Ruegeria sp. ANG-S4]
MSHRVTMRDVARAVGVSPMTVSRALRDDETVNAKTRHKIRQVANDLGYVYDTTAQAFRTQKSGFVAVTLPSINNANFAETFRGLSEGLGQSGMQLLLGSTNYQVDKEEELVRQLLTRNPEAIVLTGGHHTDETRALLSARNLPVIEIWDLPAAPLGHVVGFSNASAMAKVVTHLAEKGRYRLGFVGASENTDLRGASRRAGVIAAAAELGLPDVTIIDAGSAPVSMRHGAQAVSDLGDAVSELDALVCVSDPVAFGALSECRRRGLKVPSDIAVTGFGNFEVASVSDPRITTVGVTAREIGMQVAALLDDLFAGEAGDLPRIVDVGSRLVPGETS